MRPVPEAGEGRRPVRWLWAGLLLGCVPPAPADDDDSGPTHPEEEVESGSHYRQARPEDTGLATPQRGGGVAVADLDGDGLPELLLTDFEGSRLYRNLGGFRFEPWPAQPPESEDWGATFGDVDGDGDPDLLLHTFDRNRLVLLDGEALVEVEDPGFVDAGLTFAAPFADFDGDGHLDLYVANHIVPRPDDPNPLDGEDALYRGFGDGTFVYANELLPGGHDGRAFAARWTDLDQDGDLDLYLVNERPPGEQPNHWFRQDGGAFALGDPQCLCDYSVAGMGLGIGDSDRNGWQDLFITNTTLPQGLPGAGVGGGELLLQNQGNAVLLEAGLANGANIGQQEAGRRTISWGAEFLDADNDSWPDLYVAYGPFVEDPDSPQPNALALNDGGRFTVVEESGASDPADGRAVVPVDLDGDGCLDLVVGNTEGPAGVFEGICPGGNHWLQLRLRGADHPDAIGAQVRVTVGDAILWGEVPSGAAHSSPSKLLHFGLGAAERPDRVEVTWRSGAVQAWTELDGDARHELIEQP